MDGDMKQPEDDAQSIQLIKQPDQTKERKKGGDADSGNSEEDDKEEEKCCSDDAQNTEQPEDTNTEVHNQQKGSEKEHKGEGDHIETTRIRAPADTSTHNTEQPEDTDTEVHNQKEESEKELKEDGDNVETIGIPATADTSTQDTEQPEDTDTEVHNQQKESEKDTIGFSGQSDDQLDLDMTDGKSIKPRNENNEVLQAGEGLRKRSSKNQKIEHKGEGDNIEAIGITATADTSRSFALLLCLIAFLVLVLAWRFWPNSSSSLQKDLNLLEVFYQEMDKVQASFPSQHPELWRRSKIHLRKHLNLTDPTEPVSLILTSGRGAEKTLGCLAQQLAAAFSKARSSTFLGIDGTSKTAQDSDQVKLDIDKALKEAFEGGKQAAVIHRFEELPPGSTLIFYRYCDHENAAFKKVFLAFTVMFPEKMDFQPNVSLGMVEELVQNYLKEKFVLSDRIAKFNQMDLDKLGGLWSRISHVILPVTAELKIEQHGCQT